MEENKQVVEWVERVMAGETVEVPDALSGFVRNKVASAGGNPEVSRKATIGGLDAFPEQNVAIRLKRSPEAVESVDKSIKLDLGCGDEPQPGFIGVDRKFGSEVYPLAYPDESVDEIRASHILEHFGHGQTLHVLKEWVRVLKPGGTLSVAVPDFDKIVSLYHHNPNGLPVESYLMGGHTDANDRHGAIFNAEKLRDLLRIVGLRSIKPWKSQRGDCASLGVSLNLMGTKRGPADTSGVQAILSAPRLCFTDQSACVVESVNKLKIPMRIRQGVFWGQTMTAAIELCIESGARYILTTDYDSVFTPSDVDELLWLAQHNPDADAICAMQMGRDRDTLLLTSPTADGKNRTQLAREELDADLLPIGTGHFGLTVIKVSALAKLNKPWFLHSPDPTGAWGDGRTDEDIHFWREWSKAGNRLFQANRIPIGHLQLVATWPSINLGPIHQLVADYRTEGKPQGSWK